MMDFVYMRISGMGPRGGDAHSSFGYLPSVQTGLRPALVIQGQR
jgi:hypothetical protein